MTTLDLTHLEHFMRLEQSDSNILLAYPVICKCIKKTFLLEDSTSVLFYLNEVLNEPEKINCLRNICVFIECSLKDISEIPSPQKEEVIIDFLNEIIGVFVGNAFISSNIKAMKYLNETFPSKNLIELLYEYFADGIFSNIFQQIIIGFETFPNFFDSKRAVRIVAKFFDEFMTCYTIPLSNVLFQVPIWDVIIQYFHRKPMSEMTENKADRIVEFIKRCYCQTTNMALLILTFKYMNDVSLSEYLKSHKFLKSIPSEMIDPRKRNGDIPTHEESSIEYKTVYTRYYGRCQTYYFLLSLIDKIRQMNDELIISCY